MTIGTDALDWLAGGRDSVAFDWFPGASIERKLLRLVAAGLGVTINVFEADIGALGSYKRLRTIR